MDALTRYNDAQGRTELHCICADPTKFLPMPTSGSSGPVATETERASRDTANARLDFLSSNSLHIQATGAGHEIHLFQPERVVEGISRAVLALRTRASLVEQ